MRMLEFKSADLHTFGSVTLMHTIPSSNHSGTIKKQEIVINWQHSSRHDWITVVKLVSFRTPTRINRGDRWLAGQGWRRHKRNLGLGVISVMVWELVPTITFCLSIGTTWNHNTPLWRETWRHWEASQWPILRLSRRMNWRGFRSRCFRSYNLNSWGRTQQLRGLRAIWKRIYL
jgi:hypothetical protein